MGMVVFKHVFSSFRSSFLHCKTYFIKIQLGSSLNLEARFTKIKFQKQIAI